MSTVELRNIRKSYGRVEVIRGVSFRIEDGDFVVFVGPSGCGKSTMLRMIAGLEIISDGELLIDGAVANEDTPTQRGIAMVFQSYALYPNMTVYQNMAFGLQQQRLPKARIHELVMEAAQTLKIEPLLKRRPNQLSGGQSQRVAIGRSIVRNPKIFLFDEPLSNLDAELRVHMRVEIANLHRRMGRTTIYVTHDQVEAMTMGDRIAVMSLGLLQQLATPQELYDTPYNKFVAGFIGSPSMNFLDVTVQSSDGKVYAVAEGFRMQVTAEKAKALQSHLGQSVTLGIRPEHLAERSRVNGSIPPDSVIPVTVDVIELLGNEIFVYLTNNGITITARMDPSVRLTRGQQIEVAAPMERLYFFDNKTEAVIA